MTLTLTLTTDPASYPIPSSIPHVSLRLSPSERTLTTYAFHTCSVAKTHICPFFPGVGVLEVAGSSGRVVVVVFVVLERPLIGDTHHHHTFAHAQRM